MTVVVVVQLATTRYLRYDIEIYGRLMMVHLLNTQLVDLQQRRIFVGQESITCCLALSLISTGMLPLFSSLEHCFIDLRPLPLLLHFILNSLSIVLSFTRDFLFNVAQILLVIAYLSTFVFVNRKLILFRFYITYVPGLPYHHIYEK